MAIRNFISDAPAPRTADPLAVYGKAQQVANLISQGRANEQELQLNDQRIEAERVKAEHARRIEDDAANFSRVYMESGGDPEKTIANARTRGIRPETIQAFEKGLADLAEKRAQTAAHELPAMKARREGVLGQIASIKAMSPDQRRSQWPQLYSQLVKVDPAAAAHLSPMEPPTDDQILAGEAAYATDDYIFKAAEARQKELAAADEHKAAANKLRGETAIVDATLRDPALLNPGQRSQATIAADTAKATATNRNQTLAERIRHNRAVEAQRAASGAVSAIDDATIQQVKANPALYYTLTPTDRRKLLSSGALKEADLGKPLSDGAVNALSEMESGIQSLDRTVAAIREGEQGMGPFAGWATSKNPWASDAGKRLKSQIDLTRQLVGKGFEKGVLRKEDELKYKEILADITNTPSSAVAKLENVRAELVDMLGTWEKNQRGAGRSVPKRDTASEGGGQSGQKPVRKWNPATGRLE